MNNDYQLFMNEYLIILFRNGRGLNRNRDYLLLSINILSVSASGAMIYCKNLIAQLCGLSFLKR